MRAIFRICGNESQSGLQLVEKLVTPMHGVATARKNLSLKGLRDVKEGGISARRLQPKCGDCARRKSTLYIRLFGRVTFDRRNGPSPFFFSFFFFFTKNEGKNWFAD